MSFGRSQLSIAALFLALGFQYSTWASRIPAITERLHLSAAAVGVLLLAAGAGAVVSAPLVPKLMAAFGSGGDRAGRRALQLLLGGTGDPRCPAPPAGPGRLVPAWNRATSRRARSAAPQPAGSPAPTRWPPWSCSWPVTRPPT
jgi:hypothetical protein